MATLTGSHPAQDLLDRGLVMPAPAQVYVDRSVSLDRLQPGVMLYPGVRLAGAATFVASGALLGSEGPATLVDCAVDAGVEFCSGFAEGAVLFRGAKVGGSAHLRPATILEEFASTAHAVGLKQTVLMSYVTLGSLINACDLLVAGGTSREDHSEIGSGFIHFNFTPWGERGDKATASLVGNVHEGAFLHRRRVFVGGLSGMVGPLEIGFGAVTVAGQVIRRNVGVDRLSGAVSPPIDRELPAVSGMPINVAKLRANCHYVGQLCALRAWYVHVRLARRERGAASDEVAREVLLAGVAALDRMIVERLARLGQYCPDNSLGGATFEADVAAPADLLQALRAVDRERAHLAWVASLPESLVTRGVAWLREVSDDAARRVAGHFPAIA